MFDNGKIAWRLFWLLYREIPRLEAVSKLAAIESATVARGIGYGDSKAKQHTKHLQQFILSAQ